MNKTFNRFTFNKTVIKLRSDFPQYSYKVDFYKFDGTKYLSYINDNFVIFYHFNIKSIKPVLSVVNSALVNQT